MYVINVQSEKIYRVVRTEEFIYLERLGDGFAVRLGSTDFHFRYRPLTQQEMTTLAAHVERLERLGVPVTANMLLNAPSDLATVPEETTKEGKLVVPDERHSFDRIILHGDVKASIAVGLAKLANSAFLNDTWNMKSIEPMGGKMALNFYGPPGTGKTLSAICVAKQLGKKLLQVDYSQIISKWVGDTGKHLAGAFATAQEKNAVLFFDEADSLLSRRVSDESAASQPGINQNRNILMQELDRFDGVVIFTTNLFSNYDEALLRRIAQHVHFELPDEDMRTQLYAQHVPSEVPKHKDVNFKTLATLSKGFSGGDIKNVCINSIVAASMANPQELKQTLLISELEKVLASKESHGGKTWKNRRPIGLSAWDTEE